MELQINTTNYPKNFEGKNSWCVTVKIHYMKQNLEIKFKHKKKFAWIYQNWTAKTTLNCQISPSQFSLGNPNWNPRNSDSMLVWKNVKFETESKDTSDYL